MYLLKLSGQGACLQPNVVQWFVDVKCSFSFNRLELRVLTSPQLCQRSLVTNASFNRATLLSMFPYLALLKLRHNSRQSSTLQVKYSLHTHSVILTWHFFYKHLSLFSHAIWRTECILSDKIITYSATLL